MDVRWAGIRPGRWHIFPADMCRRYVMVLLTAPGCFSIILGQTGVHPLKSLNLCKQIIRRVITCRIWDAACPGMNKPAGKCLYPVSLQADFRMGRIFFNHHLFFAVQRDFFERMSEGYG